MGQVAVRKLYSRGTYTLPSLFDLTWLPHHATSKLVLASLNLLVSTCLHSETMISKFFLSSDKAHKYINRGEHTFTDMIPWWSSMRHTAKTCRRWLPRKFGCFNDCRCYAFSCQDRGSVWPCRTTTNDKNRGLWRLTMDRQTRHHGQLRHTSSTANMGNLLHYLLPW